MPSRAKPAVPADSEVVYTPKEIAEFLNEEEWTVREWIRKGKIKAVRMGGTDASPRKIRVPSAAYREYLSRLPAYRPTGATAAAV